MLVLWNLADDEFETLRAAGPRPLPWNPAQTTSDVGTAAEEIEAIAAAVRACGHRVRVLNLCDDLEPLLAAVRRFRPDLVFNLVESFHGRALEESWLAALVGLLQVPFTGASPLALATCQRKFRTKVLLEAERLPTPPYRLIGELPVPRRHGLSFPLIVKPAREDASLGIDAQAVVPDQKALERRVSWVLRTLDQPALVERFIEGREIHAAVIGNDPPRVLPLLEIRFRPPPDGAHRPRILSYQAKWDPLSPEFHAFDAVAPARGLGHALARRIRATALAAYRTLECRDYARVDLRIDDGGMPWVLEVNPNPDLAEGVGFMMCAEAAGMTFGETVGAIVDCALARAGWS